MEEVAYSLQLGVRFRVRGEVTRTTRRPFEWVSRARFSEVMLHGLDRGRSRRLKAVMGRAQRQSMVVTVKLNSDGLYAGRSATRCQWQFEVFPVVCLPDCGSNHDGHSYLDWWTQSSALEPVVKILLLYSIRLSRLTELKTPKNSST